MLSRFLFLLLTVFVWCPALIADEAPLPRQLKAITFEKLTDTDLFPEGPSFRKSDGSWFFSGNLGLTRVDASGSVRPILGKPGGGGTHILPDESILLIGQTGLRRIFPDGRVALLADGELIGKGNDLSLGKHGEVYFSVPSKGIFRLTPGKTGTVENVSKANANGLEVDPAGEYIYVAGPSVQRYRINGLDKPLGKAEKVYQFPKGKGGGDGCTFDSRGNFYTMLFRTGTIRVIDPAEGTLLAEIPTGVAPASNLCWGGPDYSTILATAGAPKFKNTRLLIAETEVKGFPGHPGKTVYPVVRWLKNLSDNEKAALVD